MEQVQKYAGIQLKHEQIRANKRDGKEMQRHKQKQIFQKNQIINMICCCSEEMASIATLS